MHKHEVSDYENLIYNILQSLNLDIQNNHGQGYNGASIIITVYIIMVFKK